MTFTIASIIFQDLLLLFMKLNKGRSSVTQLQLNCEFLLTFQMSIHPCRFSTT